MSFAPSVRRLRRGARPVSFGQVGRRTGGAESERPKDLSPREREVLRFLAQGYSNQQIATQIKVSVKTVETHRTRLSEKLGLKGRAELYRFAVESGILATEP